jgi:MFS family permease
MKLPEIPRRIKLLTLAIFFADASHSMVIPIFPGYARKLGASLTILGTYGSAAAIAMLILSLPLGRLSDRLGRKTMMTPGLMLFTIVPLSYIAATNPLHLYPIRMALGMGVGMIFGNGFLLISEISSPENRNMAQGLYMTSMGLGFTLGPLVGGYAATIRGPETSFILSSILAMASLALIQLVKEDRKEDTEKRELRNLGTIIRESSVQASGLANFLNALMFNALTLFFPVYGTDVGLDEAQIGVGFTTRGIVSTVVRLPIGIVTKYVKTFTLMATGLTLSALTILSLSLQTSLVILSIVMGIQGLAYGIYLTSGNVYIAEESPPSQRGTAMAVYSMFGNLGGILGPLILGIIAETTNSSGALRFSAVATFIGLVIVYLIHKRD